jgi:hypothetical protein
MFNWFKKKKAKSNEREHVNDNNSYNFKWYEIGPDNPFNKRILDIRSFTLNMIATTSSREVAEKYDKLRSSMGDEYIGMRVNDSIVSHVNLVYPHNGTVLEGVVFKADSMDCKWDIYAYNDYFYFVRSWTGDLTFKAHFKITSDSLIVDAIEHAKADEIKDTINDVHFLLISHAMGRPFPHKVPDGITNEKEVAMWSFSFFGNRACYACFDDITDTVVMAKEQ